jgi:hypothetical protein
VGGALFPKTPAPHHNRRRPTPGPLCGMTGRLRPFDKPMSLNTVQSRLQVRKRKPRAKVVDDANAHLPVPRGFLWLHHVPEARSRMATQGQGKACARALVLRQVVGNFVAGFAPGGGGTWRAESQRLVPACLPSSCVQRDSCRLGQCYF